MSDIEQTHFCWHIDQYSLNDLQQNKSIQITEMHFTGCIFSLQCNLNSSDNTINFSLLLTSLPREIGAINIDYTVKCVEIGYFMEHNSVILGMDEDRIRIYFDDLCEQYQSSIDDKVPLKMLANKHPMQFEYNISISIKYDLYGGIFASINKSMFIKSTPFNNKFVYGYINKIKDFDANKIKLSPLSIYDLIYKYYLMMLNVINSNKGEFVWKFNNKIDIDSFLKAGKDDVITSTQFEVNGCVFYLELTPNGWTNQFPAGSVNVWLALDDLPKTMNKVFVEFMVVCNDIGYKGKKTERLTLPTYGIYSTAPIHCMIRDKFKHLNQFQFECSIKIIQMTDLDGNSVDL
eukprot:401483_1